MLQMALTVTLHISIYYTIYGTIEWPCTERNSKIWDFWVCVIKVGIVSRLLLATG